MTLLKLESCLSCIHWKGQAVMRKQPAAAIGSRRCMNPAPGAARGWRRSSDWCQCYVQKPREKEPRIETKARMEHG